MQPQGLEALMQQSQPVPQMDNPRLAAATDVVSSDAEEQILDPRTLAMLKYKDALQAMQAADQMMASAQPAPTAPTVAERTKLAAEQGIAGLAQRLSPGIQQQGSQMAAQQGMQGGIPQLAAPNMTRMAGGGIVAFAPGGEVEPEDSSQEGGIPTLSEVLALLGAGGRGGERLLRSPITLMEKAGEYGPTLGELASAVAAGYKGEAPPKIPGMLERRSAGASPTTAPVDNNMPPAPRVTPSGSTNMPGGVANIPQQAPAPSGLEAVLARAVSPESQRVQRAPTSESSGLEALLRTQLEAQLKPGFADETGQAVEDRARAAYAIPQEMKDLIQARIAQAQKPEFTPEELRDRRIQAWLAGLASSPYISESGVAAAQGREGVMERSRQDEKARADQRFELAYEMMGQDREASINAYKEGVSAADRAMAQVTGAVQSAAGMVSSELNREQAALIQESQNNMEALKMQAAAVQASIERGEKNTAEMNSYYGNLVEESNNIARAIASIQQNSTMGAPITPEMQNFLDTLAAKKAIVDEAAAATRLQLGGELGVESLTPDLQAVLGKYSTPQ